MRRNFKKKDDENKKPKRPSTRRACRFCSDEQNVIDFKRPKMLGQFLTEHCKIVPRRMTGTCQYHQRCLVEAIKRARHLAMLPFTIQHLIRD